MYPDLLSFIVVGGERTQVLLKSTSTVGPGLCSEARVCAMAMDGDGVGVGVGVGGGGGPTGRGRSQGWESHCVVSLKASREIDGQLRCAVVVALVPKT